MRLRTAGAKRGLFIILFSPFQKAPWGDGEIGTLISNFFSGCTWTWGRGRGGVGVPSVGGEAAAPGRGPDRWVSDHTVSLSWQMMNVFFVCFLFFALIKPGAPQGVFTHHPLLNVSPQPSFLHFLRPPGSWGVTQRGG